jgi:DNA invertase Pin-like site-specific DNA recombinase
VPTVTKIPATAHRSAANGHKPKKKRNAAGYGRVSTERSEQKTSYEAQVDYYTKLIRANPDWNFVGVYADMETGTSIRHRDGFNEMVQDALDGKIDLIITKSVSRFARNTVDSLQTIRKLKEVGCEVWFEEQNIYTLDSKGELLLTIMSSLAQEEARNISENVTWGHRKRMADGKVSMAYKRFLGYERGEDGTPQVVESEAVVVREIYALFLEGKTIRQIAKTLTDKGISTPGGKAIWSVSTVRSILQNEKFTGNSVLQKRFTTDFLTKKTKINEGEVPQYYVENSHPGIISTEVFELAQAEMARRSKMGKHLTGGDSPFTCRIICGECSGFYGPKVWHSKDTYRRDVWQCNRKYGEGLHCATPHVTDEEVRQAFVAAFNQLLGDKERYIQDFERLCAELTDTSAIDGEVSALRQECDITAQLIENIIAENAQNALDQEDYSRRYNGLVSRFEAAKGRLEGLEREKRERSAKRMQIRRFIAELRGREGLLVEFDEQLWATLAESVAVRAGKKMTVRFRDGTEVQAYVRLFDGAVPGWVA